MVLVLRMVPTSLVAMAAVAEVVYAAVQVELVLLGKVLLVVLTSVMARRIILVVAVAVPVVLEPTVLLQPSG